MYGNRQRAFTNTADIGSSYRYSKETYTQEKTQSPYDRHRYAASKR